MENAGSQPGTTAEKKYFVVSADCHVHEPLDLWERRIEAKFRHRIPRPETDTNGKRWLVAEGIAARGYVMSFSRGRTSSAPKAAVRTLRPASA